MAVTYRLPQAGDPLQNPAYRLADVFTNEGFGVTRRTPRHFTPDFIEFLELGTYIRTYNLFWPDLYR